eukprot:CAMPEP_0114548320 /NCGR_PEP_ID=MMETSP0114-20121206/4920_1 /TAXON_ID=31324 /ORGANISM="Goniomonas sp, Strain m" /LENGTH=131 /DNA_ID=CAMNT_0001732905 /DNA_START=100 /DNA_END=495 /DNA_ORIENTATION=+
MDCADGLRRIGASLRGGPVPSPGVRCALESNFGREDVAARFLHAIVWRSMRLLLNLRLQIEQGTRSSASAGGTSTAPSSVARDRTCMSSRERLSVAFLARSLSPTSMLASSRVLGRVGVSPGSSMGDKDRS